MTNRFAFLVTALLALSTATYAADDFGPRFTNEAPAGFGNPTPTSAETNDFMADMNDIANQLQNIMPAAGDENAAETPETQNTNAPTQNTFQ